MEDLLNVNAIYISHLHPDHFDRETFRHFRPSIPIFILHTEHRYLLRLLKNLDFQNIIEIGDGDSQLIGPFSITMYKAFVKHPFHESEIGNLIDSSIVVSDKEHTVLNTNDNTPDTETAEKLKARHGEFTVAQLNYNPAGPYPSCFLDIDKDKRKEKGDVVVERNLELMARVTEILKPKYVMPFAGQYVLGGREWKKNACLGTTTWDYAAKRLLELGVKAEPLLMNEGHTFDLSEGRIINGTYQPIDLDKQKKYIAEDLSQKIYPYEEEDMPDPEWFEIPLANARGRLWKHQKEFKYFPDLFVFTTIGSHFFGFNFNSQKTHWIDRWDWDDAHQAYMSFFMDRRLLRRILLGFSHWNNAEIGCHIDFYRDPDTYLPDIHLMMSYFHM